MRPEFLRGDSRRCDARRGALGEARGEPGDEEHGHVGEVVNSVTDQRDGMAERAAEDFKRDQSQRGGDCADEEAAAHAGGIVGVAVAVRVMFAGYVDVHGLILAMCGRKCTIVGMQEGRRGAFGDVNAGCARENAMLIDFISDAAYDAKGACFPL